MRVSLQGRTAAAWLRVGPQALGKRLDPSQPLPVKDPHFPGQTAEAFFPSLIDFRGSKSRSRLRMLPQALSRSCRGWNAVWRAGTPASLGEQE